MRAITLYQPWAWLLFHGKDVENRSWRTRYRGELAIHAGKAYHPYQFRHARMIAGPLGIEIPSREDLAWGAVIGTVEVVDCVASHPSPWFFGEWGWVVRKPEEFTDPIPAKGGRMFWALVAVLPKPASEEPVQLASSSDPISPDSSKQKGEGDV